MSKALDRIAKALALADGAATEAERDLAMEKAISLANASRIELTVARAHQLDKTKREMPEERAIRVNDYTRSRARDYFMRLFSAIARANDCKVLVGGGSYMGYALGFPSDIDVVEALYATLSVQMEQEATAALKRGANKVAKGEGFEKSVSVVDGRIWRREFYDGFIARIDSRLWAAKREAERRAGEESKDTSSSTEVALRDKTREVDDFYREKTSSWQRMGTWKPSQSSGYDYSGTARDAGHAAGARASLGNDDDNAMTGNRRGAISG